MALTVSTVKNSVFGDTHVVFADLVIDEYATGGIPLGPTDLGLSDALSIIYAGIQPTDGYLVDYDSGKIVVYAAQGTEESDRTDLSASPFRAFFVVR